MAGALSLLPCLISDPLYLVFLRVHDELVVDSVLGYKALSAIVHLAHLLGPSQSGVQQALVVLDHAELPVELVIEVLLGVGEDISPLLDCGS